jgi:type I restriction enzyme S subunit
MNGIYKPQSAYGQGTPIVRIDDFDIGGDIITRTASRVELSDKEVVHYGLLQGDIVINRVNSLSHLGKSALVGIVSEPTVFESNMMRLRVNSALAEPEFVFWCLNSAHTSAQISRAAKRAVAQASVNQHDIESLQLLMPPSFEQGAIIRVLRCVQGAVRARQRELDLERERKAALMQHLFTQLGRDATWRRLQDYHWQEGC